MEDAEPSLVWHEEETGQEPPTNTDKGGPEDTEAETTTESYKLENWEDNIVTGKKELMDLDEVEGCLRAVMQHPDDFEGWEEDIKMGEEVPRVLDKLDTQEDREDNLVAGKNKRRDLDEVEGCLSAIMQHPEDFEEWEDDTKVEAVAPNKTLDTTTIEEN